MDEAPSVLSFAAAGFYALTVVACLIGAFVAFSHKQQHWHAKVWIAISVLFIALIFSRIFSIEEAARIDLRGMLRSENLVEDRRIWQGYIVAGTLALCAALGLIALYRIFSQISGRRNIAVLLAATSSGAMMFLVALRIISLHSLDKLLFGPLKLNWIGDIGSTAIVILAAAYYAKRVRQPSPPRQRARH